MQQMILQKAVFPQDEKLTGNWELFYRSPRCIIEDGKMLIPAYQCVDFSTYVNGFPYDKWSRYTGVQKIGLRLKATGDFKVTLTGYSQAPQYAVRKEYGSQRVQAQSAKPVLIWYEQITDAFLAFEISAFDKTVLEEVCYICEVEERSLRPVRIAIATTTCRKEAFITGNVRRICDELLNTENEDISKDLYVNVVDNGETLSKEQIEIHSHVRLYPNHNTGGSGGYARGMMESLHQKEEITHVLLMDDDVLVLPESIRRTYVLLRMALPEYQNAFVSGAMMVLDAMWRMHEDVGVLKNNKDFYHVKKIRGQIKLRNILETNREIPNVVQKYAGWWFCCIPAQTIREKGLPLPLFLRGDDVEYGIRCNPVFMTMTGICVWHQGFDGKFSASTNFYQEFRNMFIVKDATGLLPELDMEGRLRHEMFRALLTYHYDGAELLLLALEDYMKGVSFIREDHSLELLKRNGALNEKYRPLEEFGEASFLLEDVEKKDKGAGFSLTDKIVYYWGYNGQKFGGNYKLKEGPGVIAFGWGHQPGMTAFYRRLLVVNTIDRTGVLRTRNIQRFKELFSRYQKDLKEYKERHSELEKEYREHYQYLTSEEFWRKYLGI